MEDSLIPSSSAGHSRLRSQARNIILNVFEFFRTKGNLRNIGEVEAKTAEAVQISCRSVRRYVSQGKKSEHGIIKSPLQHKRQCHVLNTMDDFDREAIRREILCFYERGELPTLDLLLEKVKNPPINYAGGRTTLWKLVRDLGFRYKRHKSCRAILMERNDIVAERNKYLREILKNRKSNNPRPEIFLDETWINQNASVERCWTSKDGAVGPRLKSGKGARFIIVHAGGENSFIPGALLMFRSRHGNKGDYHDSMNHETFKKWFLKQLLPNIPSHSLIVMDNAPYHSKRLNKAPTSQTRKAEIIQWLQENSIIHDPTHSRSELLQVAQEHKKLQRYEVDELAAAAGHRVLRLPPYYCQFNPIELIWAQVKDEVKKKNSNSNQSLQHVENITKQAIENITKNNWQNCIEHVHKIEEDYRSKDVAFEHMYESFTIDLLSSSDSSSESEESDAE